MNLDYIKEQRNLPFIKKGMRVEYTHEKIKTGKIIGGNSSGNLNVLFDGKKKPENCHPTWAMRYFDDDGKVIAEFCE